MKVILLEKIEKLGEKYEVVEVSDGYARNFLLPQSKAQMATEGNLKNLENMKEKEKMAMKEERAEIEKIISKLDGKEFVIKMKVGEKDQLYESVTKQKISERLEEEGFEISEKQIDLNDPIKELTEKEIDIKFNFNLNATVKIKIEESK